MRLTITCLEAQVRAPHAHDVAVGQCAFAVDARAVDLGAVGGAEVDDDERVAAVVHLGVLAADVGVGQGDRALGQAADGDDPVARASTRSPDGRTSVRGAAAGSRPRAAATSP